MVALEWTVAAAVLVAVASAATGAAPEIASSKDGSKLLMSVAGARLVLESINDDGSAAGSSAIPCGGPLGHPGVEVVNGQCVPKQDVAAMTKEMIQLYVDTIVEERLKAVNSLAVSFVRITHTARPHSDLRTRAPVARAQAALGSSSPGGYALLPFHSASWDLSWGLCLCTSSRFHFTSWGLCRCTIRRVKSHRTQVKTCAHTLQPFCLAGRGSQPLRHVSGNRFG